MTEADVYMLSERHFAGTVDRIPDGRWDELTPAWFPTGPRGRHPLRSLVNYHAYDTAWVPDTLAGRTIEEVGTAHDGDLLGDDPRGAYRRHSERAIAAAHELDDLERTVHLTYGDFPAREYLMHITVFRTFRAHDLARWLSLTADLPPDLVSGLWEWLEPQAEALRTIGVFGPAVPVPQDAPLADRLLGIAGRDPRAPAG